MDKNKLELQIIKQVKPVIEFNFEEIKLNLEAKVEKFRNLIVTKETLPECKETQRELASLRIKINDKGKEINRELILPITACKNQFKELAEIIMLVENPIKQGLKVFDEQRKEEKLEKVKELRDDLIIKFSLNEIYSKKIILDQRFTNITTTMKDIRASLTEQISNLKQLQDSELEKVTSIKNLIKDMNTNYKLNQPLTEEEFSIYLNSENINLTLAISEITSRAKHRAEGERKAVENSEFKTRVNNRIKKLTDFGLKFNGSEYIYEDINFHLVEIKTMTDDEFDKAYAGAKIRKEQIDQQDSEPSEKAVETHEEQKTESEDIQQEETSETEEMKEYTLKFKCPQMKFNDITIFLFQNGIDFEEI